MGKKYMSFIIALLFAFIGKGQTPFEVCWGPPCSSPMFTQTGFDDAVAQQYFYFDSTQTNNLWQIGVPSKPVFNASYNGTRALITDSVNVYPVNNISTFYFKTIVHHPQMGTNISFDTRYLCDSTKDGGTIEISHDNGITWINLITDPQLIPGYNGLQGLYPTADTISSAGKPGYTGNSAGWRNVSFAVLPTNSTDDTLIFKFTFTSDVINTSKDGWMIDGLNIGALGEGIKEYDDANSISVSPNPATDKISFSSTKTFTAPLDIVVYDQLGQVALKTTDNSDHEISVGQLTSGIYFITFKNKDFYSSKKIIIQK